MPHVRDFINRLLKDQGLTDAANRLVFPNPADELRDLKNKLFASKNQMVANQ